MRILWLLILWMPQALAGGALSLGSGNDIRLARIAWIRPWEKGGFSGQWELAVAGWHRDAPDAFRGNVFDASLTPVLHWGGRGFIEGGIGLHLLDGLESVEDRLSGNVQFGSLLGAGLKAGAWTLGLRVMHLSNGGLSRPNRGVNILLLRIAF